MLLGRLGEALPSLHPEVVSSLNGNALRCASPSSTTVYSNGFEIYLAQFEVSLDGGATYISPPTLDGIDNNFFRWYATPTFGGVVTPTQGVAAGGTWLQVNGVGFTGGNDDAAVRCTVGGSQGSAELHNDTSMRCLTPAGAAGEVEVAVSLNYGADWHRSSPPVVFNYVGVTSNAEGRRTPEGSVM